jgi:hypothetical protein
MAGDSSDAIGVVTAPQAGAAPLTVFAAPATSTEFNTLGERLVPKACFKVEDLLFDFGSSFIRPEMKDHLPKLTQLRNDNKVGDVFPPLSIFGHADPVGDDDLNKVLSGRRAIAFYAMLVRDADLWESLFTPPVHDDNWGTRSVQTMLSTVQEPIGIDGTAGPETQTAIRTFQKANGLGVDGVAGPATRKVLYRAYMDKLCGPDLQLDKSSDFLARNKDGAGGKGDFQGCSEFNPLRVFSKAESARFSTSADHKERNAENAPNRRVVVLLFAPGRRVNPTVWPCPRAKEGVAACKKRFFPDAEARRNPQDNRREFEDTKNTFACRFYQIISDDSPCERVKPAPPTPVLLGVNPLILFALSDPTVTATDSSTKQSFVSATAPSTGAVTPLKDIVLVKKPYTNPNRVEVVLKTDTPFDGDAVLTVNDPNKILLFATRASKTPLTFNNIDNKFKGAQLDPKGPGISLFAEGKTASTNMRDFLMTLHLSGGTKKPGPDAVARMTAIELVLDICAPRVNATTAPVPLPQAPAVTPAPPTDKFFLGRPIPIQDDAKIQERAMLIVRPVKTTGFAALNRKLVLVRVGSHLKTFANETPASTTSPEAEIPARHTLSPSNTDTNFFVEGVSESAQARDNNYQLGIDGLDGDGDRVTVTVVHSEIVSNKKPADVRTVARVEEKPARVTRSTFFAAPRIVGLKFPVEVRAFVLKAAPQAFQWTIQGTATATLTDTDKRVLKMTATRLSAKQDDTMLQVRVTTDIGQFLHRHRITAVQVTLDSVANADIFAGTPAINSIRNPAGLVILTGADAADATKVAKVEMVKFPSPAVPAAPGKPGTPATPEALGIEPNLAWTDDDDRIAWWIIGDDGGQYTGKADFRNAESAKRGTKIEVFGTKEGDVLIQPYSGGFGYGMLRTNVVNLRKIKYRVNRISTNPVPPVLPSPGKPGKPGKPGHGPTRSHQDALNHIRMTNVYLRQSGIELIPDNSTDVAAKTHNSKIGVNATDAHVVSVTASALSTGHFDVVVDLTTMTFRAQDFGNAAAEGAIRVNARNEIITFAYIESLASGTQVLAQAQLIPTNHAKGGVLADKGVPSSSLIKKTGIPGDTPVAQVTMAVLQAIRVGAQPPTPANGARNVNLLWGVTVPTTSIDNFVARPDIVAIGANSDMIYGATLAHEVGHMLGLRHRIPPGVLASPTSKAPDPFPDRISTPKTKNLMFPQLNVATAENLDIVQVKAIRLSEVLARNP